MITMLQPVLYLFSKIITYCFYYSAVNNGNNPLTKGVPNPVIVS